MHASWSDASRLQAYQGNEQSGFELNGTIKPAVTGSDAYCLPNGDCGAHAITWYSSLPNAYLETVKVDDSGDLMAVGTPDADDLVADTSYVSWIDFVSNYNYSFGGTTKSHLYGQYDLDMWCGICGDAGFFSDGAEVLQNDRSVPFFKNHWGNVTC